MATPAWRVTTAGRLLMRVIYARAIEQEKERKMCTKG